jgi:hypothetical protein
MAVLTLPPQLQDGPQKVEIFVRACQALIEHSENFPVAPYLVAMLKALDMEHKFGFPERVRMILDQSKLQPEEMEDIPMEMQISMPLRPRRRQGVPASPGITSESVGEILARWAGPSSEEPQ